MVSTGVDRHKSADLPVKSATLRMGLISRSSMRYCRKTEPFIVVVTVGRAAVAPTLSRNRLVRIPQGRCAALPRIAANRNKPP